MFDKDHLGQPVMEILTFFLLAPLACRPPTKKTGNAPVTASMIQGLNSCVGGIAVAVNNLLPTAGSTLELLASETL